ncbi:MAG: hypothetical protein M3Z64_10755 [Verrucomicrobiota bacterium]|nr:hypothetical protein [Verrucomicrobiota bacterium]
MSNSVSDDLDTYLNDHLAGAVAALELIEHLAKQSPGSNLKSFLAELHVEVMADQDLLRDLMKSFAMKESVVRKAGAWIAEKFGQAKLGKENDGDGVGLLQGLEGLVLGITGKQLLWRALQSASGTVPQLQGADYPELERRATEQRDRVEQHRLIAARAAFVPGRA